MTTPDQRPPKQGKSRSPAYPVVALTGAIDSARKLWNAQRRQESHVDSALKCLGYSARSGAALRAISALSQYGLINESGSKDARKVRLSDAAIDIILLNETDPRREEAIKKAAVLPTVYAALWERYGAHVPDDGLVRPFLTRDKNFNESVVDSLLANYRATLEFAKLDKMRDDNPREEHGDTQEKRKTEAHAVRRDGNVRKEVPMTFDQELPILVGENRVARIPFPMTEDDFTLLIGTLNLWKKKLLTVSKPTQDAKGETANADEQ